MLKCSTPRGVAILALPLLLAASCAGEVETPAGDGRAADSGGEGLKFSDGPAPTDAPGPGQDGQPPDSGGPCARFGAAGQSCAGGQSCPTGQQAAALNGTPCACYVSCDPGKGKWCSPQPCGFLCVQLVDSSQKPLPGVGACVEDPGAGEGEPCTPQCKQNLVCVSHGSQASFCRKTCAKASDCPGYKMVCGTLSSSGSKVCIPGGSTTGPKVGESCAAPTDYCVQGLICDPATKSCLTACNPKSSACSASQTCSKLADAGIVIGYGCL